MKKIGAFVERHLGSVMMILASLLSATLAWAVTITGDVREIRAQLGPPPHVLVDAEQAKSDHDLLIELRTDVRAIKAAVVKP